MARREQRDDVPGWHWVAGLIGMVLFAGVSGLLIREALTGQTDGAAIAVEPLGVEERQGEYVVHLRLVNRGGETAADVEVEGEIAVPGGPSETGSVTIPYIPAGSERGATLSFTHDPREHPLRLRARGYRPP